MCQFDLLIPRKIIKTVATRSRISNLQCTKLIDFGWCFAHTQTAQEEREGEGKRGEAPNSYFWLYATGS